MHLNGFSLVGPLIFLQVASYLEALFNFENLKGFSLMWVLSKFYKWSDFKRLLSHFEHLKSFSPVWVLSYSFKEHDREKLLLHFICLNGISPVWALSCSFKWLQVLLYSKCRRNGSSAIRHILVRKHWFNNKATKQVLFVFGSSDRRIFSKKLLSSAAIRLFRSFID